ncbi:MAG: SLC13 family permease [Candidatus Neomarinimicrobiota bacterium]|nr:SLC13 family permease [Candidatus Neomarinimicrobiota bacterium]
MFSLEWAPFEVTAFAAVGILLLFNIITPEQAVSGFSNKAVITIAAMFVLSRAIEKTGFLEVFADKLYTYGGNHKWLTIFIFLLTVALISGFINNTASVAIFIPLATNLCQKFKISPSKLLLPLSYAAIFGGTLTLIGTSTNLVVSSFMEEHVSNVYPDGISPFSMFEFTKLGIIFLIVGIFYVLFASKWLLHSRAIISSLTRKYHLGPFFTEFKVGPDSPLVGNAIKDLEISKQYELEIYMIIRDKKRIRKGLNSIIIQENDILMAHVAVNKMMRFSEEMNMLLLSDVKMTQKELTGKNHVIVEAIVSQYSNMIGQTFKSYNFRNMFDGIVLAVRRQRETLREKIGKIILRFSDTLLILIPKGKLEDLRNSSDLIVLEELKITLKYERYWWLSILVIPVIMGLASFGIVPIMKGSLLGVIILLVLKSISIHDVYESLNLQVIFLIAALLPIGHAITTTGTDKLLADFIYSISNNIENSNFKFRILVGVIYLLSMVLSAFISNTAIGVVMTPIAISISEIFMVDPRPFLIAVCFGASASFLTPMGYQTNLMVFGPGRYKFIDFIKAGLPLSIIYWILAFYFIPIFWPFTNI